MSRFYIVQNKTDDAAYCVVEANTAGGALRRAAEQYCTVRPASPRDVLEAMKWERDVIEIARGEQQEFPLEAGETVETKAEEETGEII